MKKILGNSWLVLGIGLLIAGSGYLYTNRRKTASVPEISQTNQQIMPSVQLHPLPDISPAPATNSPQPKPTVTSRQISGGTPEGRLTCAYLIPATPDSQGTARLDAGWNHLFPGGNRTKAAVCVSANGGSYSLMSVAAGADGATAIEVPWISLNADYNFGLFDQHGGDLPDCAGVLLASCRINTKSNL